jgi:hypothetical protein
MAKSSPFEEKGMSQNIKTTLACIAAASATLLAGCASTGGLHAADVGSFHIGGKQAVLSDLPELDSGLVDETALLALGGLRFWESGCELRA